jgi:hypothetical protein
MTQPITIFLVVRIIMYNKANLIFHCAVSIIHIDLLISPDSNKFFLHIYFNLKATKN